MNLNIITEMFMNWASAALFLCAVLTALTNIVVEVVKGFLPRIPTALLVILVAEGITVPALLLIAKNQSVAYSWYFIFGAVVLGVMVAYGAMGNFDKLTQIIGKLKEHAEKA